MSAVERMPKPQDEIRSQLIKMDGEFADALPAHIPVERFRRVALTAIMSNTDLITKVERRSLFQALTKAAQDGLLPDGRDGAIVIYGNQAQWMPMIGGIRKKVRNSGEIVSWEAHAVFENDEFEFELGDDPFIKHKPTLNDRGKIIAAYSIATLKGGEKSREVMSVHDIEKVRNASRAKNSGPWTQWYEEMARKTVARRHSKVLPMSTDLDDLIRRDDDLYAMDEASDRKVKAERPTLESRLDALAGSHVVNAETGEVIEAQPVSAVAEFAKEVEEEASRPSEWAQKGYDARRKGIARRAVPKGLTREQEAEYLKGWDDANDELGGE